MSIFKRRNKIDAENKRIADRKVTRAANLVRHDAIKELLAAESQEDRDKAYDAIRRVDTMEEDLVETRERTMYYLGVADGIDKGGMAAIGGMIAGTLIGNVIVGIVTYIKNKKK